MADVWISYDFFDISDWVTCVYDNLGTEKKQ